MRYERIELDISTAGCDLLMDIIGNSFDHDCETLAEREVANLYNQLRARLQHLDADPHCPKNQISTEQEWLDV